MIPTGRSSAKAAKAWAHTKTRDHKTRELRQQQKQQRFTPNPTINRLQSQYQKTNHRAPLHLHSTPRERHAYCDLLWKDNHNFSLAIFLLIKIYIWQRGCQYEA